MQGYQGTKKTKELNQLITKISRLRRKLLSYGWSMQQIIQIILFEFLKLPKINWKQLKNTPLFYQVKEKYKVDSGTAELVLCLQQIVPNLHIKDVCQYLLNVLLYNSLEFGFNLDDSSSDSNESSSILYQKLKYRPKLRMKRKKTLKKQNLEEHGEKNKKKVKKTEEVDYKIGNSESQKLDQQQHQRYLELISMKEPAYKSFQPSQQEMQKKIKKQQSDCQ